MIRVLLIEDDPAEVELVRASLEEGRRGEFEVEAAHRLDAGIHRVRQGEIDAVLLDLSLPDSDAASTVRQLKEVTQFAPVVVLTGRDVSGAGRNAMQQGAQEYLVKGTFGGELLGRIIRHAIVRHGIVEEIEVAAGLDPLTGLYNRRNFDFLAEQQMKLADRGGRPLVLAFIDLDRLKYINDTFGHREGDEAIKETAYVLRETFRESDIIARYGGDEFLVLAIESSPQAEEILRGRLKANTKRRNAEAGRLYELKFSVGIASYAPTSHVTLEDLIRTADLNMLRQKKRVGGGRS